MPPAGVAGTSGLRLLLVLGDGIVTVVRRMELHGSNSVRSVKARSLRARALRVQSGNVRTPPEHCLLRIRDS